MIIFQLFETTQPFAGHDPVEAARNAAMLGARPGFPPRGKLTDTEMVSRRVGVQRAVPCEGTCAAGVEAALESRLSASVGGLGRRVSRFSDRAL